jgi:hypothetical protein
VVCIHACVLVSVHACMQCSVAGTDACPQDEDKKRREAEVLKMREVCSMFVYVCMYVCMRRERGGSAQDERGV